MKRHRSTGFTLLEVVITTAVLAILMLVALPATGERLERTRLQAVAEALVADLGTARLEATQGGQPLHLTVAGGPDWCWSVSVVAGCDCGVPASCQLRRVSSADHPGFSLVEAQGVDFGANDHEGTAARKQIAVLESRHGERVRVDLTALGRPRLCLAASQKPALWRLPAC